jgi:hypothetical protein
MYLSGMQEVGQNTAVYWWKRDSNHEDAPRRLRKRLERLGLFPS